MGLVSRILLSGSTRGPTYDEPAAMRELALRLGVPDSAIDLDRGGTRTLETCLRARDLFGVRRALLVSQRYHLPRALILCDALGIDAVGAAADLRPYSLRSQRIWELREIPASFVAVWESIWLRLTTRAAGSAMVEGDPHGA
jgi:vancomycin permeability regulator SanA